MISDSKSQLINVNGNSNYLRFFPAGTSIQCFLHFKQMMLDGKFRKFDYGSKEKNQAAYDGADEPPEYDFNSIKGFNISLICGQTDLLSSPVDYSTVKNMLSENDNNVDFQEYEEGHIGLVVPKNLQITTNMFDAIVKDWNM